MDDILIGDVLGPRVIDVSPKDDHILLLRFNNGEKRQFDAKPLLAMEVFKPLSNTLFFKSVKVAYGSIMWPNDIDYCPDTLYEQSTKI